jgi:cytochrome c-type biogenesis protein CcmH/NrfG
VKSRIALWSLLIAVVVTGVLYARSSNHARLPEDELVVWNNPAVTATGLHPACLGRFYDSNQDGLRPTIRPVATMVTRVEWFFFHGDRSGFQWVQIGLLGLGGLLLGLLWFRRHRTVWGALIAALWLVVHPIASASVLTLAGMGDLLALDFLLLALLAASRSLDERLQGPAGVKWLAVCGAALLLGAWSRETALAGVGVLVVYGWVEQREDRVGGVDRTGEARARRSGWSSETARLYLALGLVLVLFLVHRMVSMGALPLHLRLGHTAGAGTGLGLERRLLVGLAMVPTALRLCVFPRDLGYSYDYLLSAGQLGLRAACGAVLLLGLTGLLVQALRRGWVVTVWVALLLFPLIGATGIVVPLTDFDTERLLLPALPGFVGVVICGAHALQSWRRARTWAIPGLVLALVAAGGLSWRTLARERDFVDWETLIKAEIRTYPGSAQGRLDLGNTLLARGLWSGAISEYTEAVRLRPDLWTAWVNLGAAYLGQQEPGLAMRSLDQALAGVKDRPEFVTIEARAQYNRALILMQQNRNPEAVQCLKRMLEVFPDHVSAHANLGFIYSTNSNFTSQAKYHLGRAMELEKDPERQKVLQEFFDRVEKRHKRTVLDEESGGDPSGDHPGPSEAGPGK